MPIQSPPDPISELLYKIFYSVKSLWHTIFKRK